MLREAVRGIAGRYGHDYYLRESRSRRPRRRALAGSRPRRLPRRRTSRRSTAAAAGASAISLIVCEELAAAGTPSFLLIVSSTICAELLVGFGTEEQRSRVASADGVG